MPTLAPRVAAIPNEANAIAPRRRGAPIWHGVDSSDGGYVNKPGGHNIGARDLVHAWDVSQSMPGTPYWDPKYQQFDAWGHCYRIAREYTAASDVERQRRWPWLYDGGYMVWFDGTKDIIFGPKHDRDLGQEPHIRQNGDFKTEHFQHAHIEAAETVRAEQDTQPIFTTGAPEDDDVNDQDKKDIANQAGVVASRAVIAALPDLLQKALEEYVDGVLGGYPDGIHYEPAVLRESVVSEARKSRGLSKKS